MIEIMQVITIISVFASLVFGGVALRRGNKKDDSDNASNTATIIAKLDNIGTDVSEIKNEMTGIKKEVSDSKERIAVVEQSTKTAHKRLDSLENLVHKANTEA